MCCAREANINAISANGESPSVAESSKTRRTFSPVAVPPGSRVSTTLCPAARSTDASLRICVLLPVPSSPSKVINFPRRAIFGMISARLLWSGHSLRQAQDRLCGLPLTLILTLHGARTGPLHYCGRPAHAATETSRKSGFSPGEWFLVPRQVKTTTAAKAFPLHPHAALEGPLFHGTPHICTFLPAER